MGLLVDLVLAALGRLVGTRGPLLDARLIVGLGVGGVSGSLGTGGLDVLVIALGRFLGVYGPSLFFAHRLHLSLVFRFAAAWKRRPPPFILTERYGSVPVFYRSVHDGYQHRPPGEQTGPDPDVLRLTGTVAEYPLDASERLAERSSNG